MVSGFQGEAEFAATEAQYKLLPFRFARLDGLNRYVAVNETGEWQVLSRPDLEALIRRTLARNSALYHSLQAKHFLEDSTSNLAADLLVLKLRTQRQRISDFTSLHMFVVTLRCNHSCTYCQVSRQNEGSRDFDMNEAVAAKAVDFVFQSPAPALKIEFQGGEPLLNFPIVRFIVEQAEKRNEAAGRHLSFVMATNLSLLSAEVLDFCRVHEIHISTSLDGPEDLHNANRPNAGRNSHQLAVEGIGRARACLGLDRVSALMTATQASLGRSREIIDEYVRHGFAAIFLRSLSPFGYAIQSQSYQRYGSEQWLDFYRQSLDYILRLNQAGTLFVEQFTALLLQKMLTPYGTGFVNLQSPAGMGIAGIVYNYNGEVYPSDEARMKAAMGDRIFCMGNLLTDSYAQVMLSPALLAPLEASVAESVPLCEECAFLPYCGSDPDFHYATQADYVGHKARSGLCKKHQGVFRHLLQTLEDDRKARAVLESWVRW